MIVFRLNDFMGRRDTHLVLEATVADCSSATETISNMTSSTTTPLSNSTQTTTSASASTHKSQAYGTTFGMPSGIKLSQFDGSDWSNWSGMLEALLMLHEAEDVFMVTSAPSGVDNDE